MSRIQICVKSLRRCRILARTVPFLLIVILLGKLSAQSLWTAVGPAGGDARAFAVVPGQPNHLYLGTINSWIYESLNGGASWRRMAKLDQVDDLALDNIVVDESNPSTIFVAAWRIGLTDGGLWVSHDAGQSWNAVAGLRGQSIRAFAQAPSNPKLLFAGTLDGVFRSTDGGVSWSLISPPASKEIHEVESLAVDPVDPNIVYAGTWHLPWKTVDGGKNWKNIKQGVIEDSDVFSIILDSARSSTVYLSACSGIYKSENAGDMFHKIQGIPSDARRTRVLMQDPAHHDVVYAGTTQGLYKTTDAGNTFKNMTSADVIVNDVFVDPKDSNHVLLATDRGGVLASTDGGTTFVASNEGFSERKVDALLVDHADPARMYAGVVNDKTYGGAFFTINGGVVWQHIGEGLEGRDVFALAQAQDGTVVAGTSRGIFALTQNLAAGVSPHWEPRNRIANTHLNPTPKTQPGKPVHAVKKVIPAASEFNGRVSALDLTGNSWLASTSLGLFTSKDQGATWQGGPVMDSGEYISVATLGTTMAAARSDAIVFSTDAGASWTPLQLPGTLTRLHRVAFSSDGTLWLGAREGVYYSQDNGKSWLWIERLPFRDVNDLTFDTHLNRIVVSSRSSDQIYAIDPKTTTWKWWKTGYRLSAVRAAGDHMVAASLYDGVLVEPTAGRGDSGQK